MILLSFLLSSLSFAEPEASPAEESPQESESKNESKKPNRFEVAGLPALSYDSDSGLGLGIVAVGAKFNPKNNPFQYRLMGLIQSNIRSIPGEGLKVPTSTYFLRLDMPGRMNGKLRVVGFGGYTSKNDMPYFGYGNQTSVPFDGLDEESTEYQDALQSTFYGQRTGILDVQGQWSLFDESTMQQKKRLELIFGGHLRYESPEVFDGSVFQRDIELANAETEDGETMDLLLNGTDPHFMFKTRLGLLWDTRDHEYVPQNGSLHYVYTEFSPGVQEGLLFNRWTVDLRSYKSILGEYLVLAGRLAGTVYFGTVPFYETDAYLSSSVMYSWRGVRLNRYRGTRQALGSVELRSKLLKFGFGGQRFNLGITLFADTGRVWNTTPSDTLRGASLNGDFMDFHTSIGGGPRLQWGETFLLRFDQGYSVTDKTSRVNFLLNHAF
ncbi:MAG: BamA/TamA family outer membrane protein [Myxococcota bacterium]|nr:BamA/TamA family outer membrane protein [Myxococcota bacterium]